MINQRNAEKKLNLVFDLFGTLAFDPLGELNSAYLKWFIDNNLIIRTTAKKSPFFYPTSYVLYPGTIELMQYLFKQPDINVAFFPNQFNEMSTEFVEKLLIRALGEVTYELIKNDVQIYSTVSNKHKNDKYQYKEYGLTSCSDKKDLTNFFPGEELNKTFLIDDSPEYVQYKQAHCYLHVSDILSYDLSNWKKPHGKIFYKINHIYYLLGMLIKARENKHQPLQDYIFNFQFKRNDNGTYQPQFREAQSHLEFYECGLAELRKTVHLGLKFLELKHMQPYLKAYKKQTEKKHAEMEIKNNIKKERACIKYASIKYRYLRTITDANQDHDFYHVRSQNELIIDTSLVISKMLNLSSYISVFLDPSCDKTFIFSMLHYFLAKSVNGKETDNLFDDSAIRQSDEYSKFHKKFSVINFDFSDIKANCADELKVLLHQKIAKLYQDHDYLLKNEEIRKYYKDNFDTILDMSRFCRYNITRSFIRLAELIIKNNSNEEPLPILIINHYDDLISSTYQAQPQDKGIALLRSFFGMLKDCSVFSYVFISGADKLRILPDNCHYYHALPYFACTFTETLHFLKKNNITPTPNALTQLSIPHQGSRFSERWYLPQNIIRFAKQQKRIQEHLPYLDHAMSKQLNTEKIANIPEKNRKWDTIHNFFYQPNKPKDEINKRIRNHQDSEIKIGKRM